MNDRRRRDRRNKEGTLVISPRRHKERRANERRDNERVPIDCWLEEAHEDEVSHRQAGDLSLGGMRLERGFSHPIGTRVTLRFALPGDDNPLEVAAEVVNVIPAETTMQTNYRFVELGDDERRRISEFVASVQADDASQE